MLNSNIMPAVLSTLLSITSNFTFEKSLSNSKVDSDLERYKVKRERER